MSRTVPVGVHCHSVRGHYGNWIGLVGLQKAGVTLCRVVRLLLLLFVCVCFFIYFFKMFLLLIIQNFNLLTT